jgi:hypothetical protein
MYFTGRDIAVQKAYRDEMLRQAEPWHILPKRLSSKAHLQTHFRTSMVRLGAWLEAVGCGLKARYGMSAEAAQGVAGSTLQRC